MTAPKRKPVWSKRAPRPRRPTWYYWRNDDSERWTPVQVFGRARVDCFFRGIWQPIPALGGEWGPRIPEPEDE
jgi:hypothetical protein